MSVPEGIKGWICRIQPCVQEAWHDQESSKVWWWAQSGQFQTLLTVDAGVNQQQTNQQGIVFVTAFGKRSHPELWATVEKHSASASTLPKNCCK